MSFARQVNSTSHASAAITALKHAETIDQRIYALKQVKNAIVGHDIEKELVVREGIIEHLCGVITSSERHGRNAASLSSNGSTAVASSWTEHEELILQAVLLLGILSNADTRFLAPLLASHVIAVLTSSVSRKSPHRLTTAVLQTLRNLATGGEVLYHNGREDNKALSEIFTSHSLENLFLPVLITETNPSISGQQQLRLVVDIVAKVAQTDKDLRVLLTRHHVVDALAALLVAYGVSYNYISENATSSLLPHAPSHDLIAGILNALVVLIGDSSYRTYSFILAPALRTSFLTNSSTDGDQRHLFGPRYGFLSCGRPLLPPLHIPSHTSTTYHGGSRAFPALGDLKDGGRGSLSMDTLTQGCDFDHANAVCGYLLVLARSFRHRERLMALRLLAIVNNVIDSDLTDLSLRDDGARRSRECTRQMAVLAVPLAVQLIHDSSTAKSQPRSSRQMCDDKIVEEQACGVLALLIGSKQELQAAAVEAGAIKYVCPLLKKSFEHVTTSKPAWTPDPHLDDRSEQRLHQIATDVTFPSEIVHAMRCRENALDAIAALCAKEDLYRKAIFEAGVVPCLIEAMKPYPKGYLQTSLTLRSPPSAKDGNTIPVILAACHAAKSMSRSVAALRTNLIDAGLGIPVLNLINHPNLDVQIAATNVCVNLVLEFSALREDFLAEDTIKTLSLHARSSSAALRISSLWALKHIVHSAPRELKISVLNEVGVEWLVSVIRGQTGDGLGSTTHVPAVSGLSAPNAAGEQVNLLNPSSMDIDMSADDVETTEKDDDGDVMFDVASSTHYQASQIRSTVDRSSTTFDSERYLTSVHELEQSAAMQIRRDHVAVQEQALDLIRNMLNGPVDCSFMMDHLIAQIGSPRIFDLLTAKLAPVPSMLVQPNNGRQVYHPTELVLSSVHVINHIANCSSEHKRLLVAQKGLLQAWLPHFNHEDRRVRVYSVWAINSLTWMENEIVRSECRARVRELRSLGFESKIRSLQNDPDLDVKQRVKTALQQIEQLS